MIRRDDVEFVTGPGIDLDPEAMTRVGNMMAAFHSAEDRVKRMEDDCSDDRKDDRSSAGHQKEAQRLELEAKAAEATGNEKVAEALRAKAETHIEEIGRTDDKDVKSPIQGTPGWHQPPSPKRPGTSPLTRGGPK